MARKPLDYLPRFNKAKAAGDLRHRITIQQMVEIPDGTGQPIPTWPEVITVWGLYQATGGYETEAAGDQVRSILAGVVTIRRYDGLDPKMRFVVNGGGVIDLVLNIAAIELPDPSTGFQMVFVKQPEPTVVQ